MFLNGVILATQGTNSSFLVASLKEVRDSVINERILDVQDVAVVLAALLCGFAMLKISKAFMLGEKVTFFDMFRPVLMLVIVGTFNHTVAEPVVGICDTISADLSEKCDISYSEYLKNLSSANWEVVKGAVTSPFAVAENENRLDEVNSYYNGESEGSKTLKKIFNGLKAFFTSALEGTAAASTGLLSEVLGSAMFMIMNIVWDIQIILTFIYQTLLNIVGPLVFAFGILDTWKNRWSSWLARYIQISLWIPLGFIIILIMNTCLKTLAEMTDQAMFNMSGMSLCVIIFCLATLKCLRSIPSIAGWIIESTGSAGAHKSYADTGEDAKRKAVNSI